MHERAWPSMLTFEFVNRPTHLQARAGRAGRRLLAATALVSALALPASAAPREDPMARRVAACTVCHGDQGRAGTDTYYPRIAGKPEGYLYNQLVNFREGRRQYALMTYLVDHLPDPYLLEMAGYFAGLNPPYPAPAPANASSEQLARGRALALSGDAARQVPACVQCHAQSMMGVAPGIPGLLGLPRPYLAAQLGAWKVGTRRAAAPDCMAQIAQQLTPDDIAAVSAWLAAQPVPPGAKPATDVVQLPMPCGAVPQQARSAQR